METINFVLGGLGGQGILYMTKVLANTALAKGFRVMGAETHGMAQRGGSVISHLRMGHVHSSLIKNGSAHFLLALEENEAYRNLPFLRKGGHLFSDTGSAEFPRSGVKAYLDDRDISYHGVPAGRIALELDIPMSSNLALIGFFSAFKSSPFNPDELRNTIEKLSPARFQKSNLMVFDRGLQWGRDAASSATENTG